MKEDLVVRTLKFLEKIDLKDSLAVRILVVVVVILMIAWMFPRGESIEFEYRIGMIWVQKDLIAPLPFPIYKDDRDYERQREEAAREVYPVFYRRDERLRGQLDTLRHFFSRLRAAVDFRVEYQRKLDTQARGDRRYEQELVSDSLTLAGVVKSLQVSFTSEEWGVISLLRSAERRRSRDVVKLRTIEDDIRRSLSQLLKIGVIDTQKSQLETRTVALRRGSEEQITSSNRFFDRDEVLTFLNQSLASRYGGENDTFKVAYQLAAAFARPTVLFSQEETEKLVKLAQDEVPRTIGIVEENERIISKHERITELVKLKLDSLRRAKAERGQDVNFVAQYVGSISHVSMIVVLYGIYLFLFRKRIFYDNGKLVLISLLLLMESFFAYLTLNIDTAAPIEYLIFVPAAAMLLAIIFDSRVAFYGTVVMAFIVAGIRGNDYSIALASLVAGTLSVYTVRDIRNRTQIFRSLVFILIGYAVAIFALGIRRFESLDIIVEQLVFALANSVFSPVLTFGLLIFFERVFRVTTDLTLLELSDFNQPVLRLLSEKAPGTFHHSMIMGNLAETAAEAVGANSTLARVGAYYHDIGKTVKPEYFVENQMGAMNRHEKLAPQMSALILESHVKEGVVLGKEHDLPGKILDFIPMHHGTTLMSFFYDKAIKKKGKKDEVNESDFRYPGPKPQTKETGIVMLADSVEATVRSLDRPSVVKIEETIDAIIKDRFIEGQLDECELTLKDLSRIRGAFLKILVGIHHQRIKYPGQERGPQRAEGGEDAGFEVQRPRGRRVPKRRRGTSSSRERLGRAKKIERT
ncbi:MAG: HDIG domain-containing metalloprotein [Bacteroidota bacterium]